MQLKVKTPVMGEGPKTTKANRTAEDENEKIESSFLEKSRRGQSGCSRDQELERGLRRPGAGDLT